MSNPLRVYQALYGDCLRLAREYVSAVDNTTQYYIDIKTLCNPDTGKLYDLANSFYLAADYVSSAGYSNGDNAFVNGTTWSTWAIHEIDKLTILFQMLGYTFQVNLVGNH